MKKKFDSNNLNVWNVLSINTDEPAHDKTNKMTVRPAKTQISLGIGPVWSESSLSAWRNLGSLATHWAHSEDSDQTGRVPRLIWVFAGLTCHFVGFVIRQLRYQETSPFCFWVTCGHVYIRLLMVWLNCFICIILTNKTLDPGFTVALLMDKSIYGDDKMYVVFLWRIFL